MSSAHQDRKVALVTGGASGIGQATCRRLLADGFRLAVCDLDRAGAAASAGADGVSAALDVADDAAVGRFVVEAAARLGGLDVLVNNAGISGGPAATVLHATSVQDWERVMAVNVRGPFLFSRHALPVMIEQGGGHVITIASVAGQVAFPGRSAYTTSKGGALMLARSIAVDYAEHGIRSNAVCPGMAFTGMTRWRLEVPDLRREMEARIPLGRVAEADDVADLVALLASDRLGYMTGAALVIDGGYSAQ